MKVIIAGGRMFKNYALLRSTCDHYLANASDIEIVSGKQVTIDKDTGEKFGADYLGEQYAKERGYPVKPFYADWKNLGKAAGPLRNEQMAKYAEALIAFWNGTSRGTKSMIDLANQYNLLVRIKYIQ